MEGRIQKVERRSRGGEQRPLWAYQTVQECSGKNEYGSLAQDGPCDWVQMMAVTKTPFLYRLNNYNALQRHAQANACFSKYKQYTKVQTHKTQLLVQGCVETHCCHPQGKLNTFPSHCQCSFFSSGKESHTRSS